VTQTIHPRKTRQSILKTDFTPISPVEWGRTEGPKTGALVLAGGGDLRGTGILEKFLTLAGGNSARIVAIPTAGTDAVAPLGQDFDGTELAAMFLDYGAAEVDVLHTRDPHKAGQSKFAAPLKKATGVWFTGGRQWRLVDAYAETATLGAIKSVLERGGVIGGTSAGATIQGSYLVRGDTRSRDIVMGDHQEGFAFLSNCAIDQHLLRRNRQFELFSVLSEHPGLLGIGIDEETAVLVNAHRAEVIGKSYVAIYNSAMNTAARVSKNDESLQREEFSTLDQTEFRPFHLLQEGDCFDLVERTLLDKDS
jgi:cyanophycinase